MNFGHQRLCAWSGLLFIGMFLVGFVFCAGFLPPLPPSLSAEQVAAYYQAHTIGIRLGMVICMAGSALLAPFSAVISRQLSRIRDCDPVLVWTQFGAGVIAIVLFLGPAMLWTAAAFRPERDPALTYLLNDVAWLVVVMPFCAALIQNFAIGLAILSDKSPEPVFPRWLAYFNFWVAICFLPGGLITFFKVGPFAWNGLLSFWVALFVLTAWFLVMMAMLLKAIRNHEQEVAAA